MQRHFSSCSCNVIWVSRETSSVDIKSKPPFMEICTLQLDKKLAVLEADFQVLPVFSFHGETSTLERGAADT